LTIHPFSSAPLMAALALVLPGATFADTTAVSPPPALTTPSPASQPAGASLISVQRCHPKMNTNYDSNYAPATWNAASQVGHYYDPYGYNYYQPPTSTTANLFIDYTNISHKTMTSIEFGLAQSGVVIAEVKDTGKFTPGAEIKHRFGMGNSLLPLTNQVPQCVPLRITFSDGTTWKVPHLPAINKQALYGSQH
jgi:hypothetical protein